MKFLVFSWVVVVTYLVGQVVLGQPTTEEDSSCISSYVDLQDVDRQTKDMAQVLKEVRDAVVKPCTESSPQHFSTNPALLLKSKIQLITTYLHVNINLS